MYNTRLPLGSCCKILLSHCSGCLMVVLPRSCRLDLRIVVAERRLRRWSCRLSIWGWGSVVVPLTVVARMLVGPSALLVAVWATRFDGASRGTMRHDTRPEKTKQHTKWRGGIEYLGTIQWWIVLIFIKEGYTKCLVSSNNFLCLL